MPEINFPDPNDSQIYSEAGITWTWNATLGVWSVDAITADPSKDYLRKDADVGTQTVSSTARVTFWTSYYWSRNTSRWWR